MIPIWCEISIFSWMKYEISIIYGNDLVFFFRRRFVRLKPPNHIDKVSNQLIDKLFNTQKTWNYSFTQKLHGHSLNVRFIWFHSLYIWSCYSTVYLLFNVQLWKLDAVAWSVKGSKTQMPKKQKSNRIYVFVVLVWSRKGKWKKKLPKEKQTKFILLYRQSTPGTICISFIELWLHFPIAMHEQHISSHTMNTNIFIEHREIKWNK